MVRKAKKKVGLEEGAVYAIPLGDGTFSFAQVCSGKDMAFFDLKSDKCPVAEEIVKHRVIFRVLVTRDGPEVGKWTLVGQVPLSNNLAQRASYRHQPIGSTDVFVYTAGISKLASPEEASGLEVLAIWFPTHIQQRLKDHFAGVENAIVRNLLMPPKPGVRRF